MHLSAWRLPLFIGFILLLSTAIQIVQQGVNEDFIRAMMRVTARCSIVLFIAAFSASSLAYLWPSQPSKWLKANRRYVGLSFALSHFYYLFYLVLLISLYPREWMTQVPLLVVILALTGYVFLVAMTITSFKGPRVRLGEANWRRLHLTGMYVIWLIFVETYAAAGMKHSIYLVAVGVLLLAWGLRWLKWWRIRQPVN